MFRNSTAHVALLDFVLFLLFLFVKIALARSSGWTPVSADHFLRLCSGRLEADSDGREEKGYQIESDKRLCFPLSLYLISQKKINVKLIWRSEKGFYIAARAVKCETTTTTLRCGYLAGSSPDDSPVICVYVYSLLRSRVK